MEKLLDREEARLARMTMNLTQAEDEALGFMLHAMADSVEKGLDKRAESTVESEKNGGYPAPDKDLPEQLWPDPEAEFWKRELEEAAEKETDDEKKNP